MTRKWTLRRIGLWSAVKAGFVVSAALGLIMGIFWGMVFAFFASLLANAASMRDPGIGPGAVIIMPVFSALFLGGLGASAALLAALVYNLAAGAFGGLELEIDDGDTSAQPQSEGNISTPERVYTKMRRIWRKPPSGLAARRGGTAW
jgi:hypothetical protein